MKKVFAILLTLVLILTNGITVLAEEVSTPPANQISADPNSSFTTVWFDTSEDAIEETRNGEDGLKIVMAHSGISRSGSSAVIAYAETESNISAGLIGGTVRVQRWSNNSWSTYYSFIFEAYNTTSASVTRTVSVEPGYYYRVRVAHYAFTAYTSVSKSTTTESIYLN